jgi:hypothetical protein
MSQKFKSQIDAEQGIKVSNELYDGSAAAGNSGQVLSSTGSATQWVDLNADSAKRLEVDVKNVHGATLAKGTVVHAEPTGTLSGNVIEVVAADANTKMPAIGVLNEALLDDGEGKAVMFGTVQGIDTSSFSVGDELYVSATAGQFTATKPTATTEEVQKIAIVVKSHASNGLIKVFGAGRSNDVPNLLTRDITIDGADFVFGDSDQIQMGTPLGLRIQHASGGHSYIDGEVGNLYIRAEANDTDMVFQADDGAGGNITYFRLDGGLATHDGTNNTARYTVWGDNSRIALGDSQDLQIYHDGTNSYIEQATANDLIITNTGAAEVEIKSNRKVNIYIDQNNDDTTNSFNILSNVSTYAANDVIFEVTQTGNVNIDGSVVADGSGTFDTLTLTSGNDNLTFTQSGDDWTINNAQQNNGITIYDGATGVDINYNGSSYFEVDATGVHTAANIDFYVDTNLIYADAANNLVGIGKTPSTYKLDVAGKIASNDYIIAGLGSGGVALTHNDGEGNANVTFNHVSGIPEQNGNSFRIRANTDSSSGAVMRFEIKEGVTADTAVDTIEVFRLDPDGPKVRQAGGGNISLQRDDTSIVDGNPLGRIRFSGDDPTNDVFNRGAEIRAEAAGTWSLDNYPTELQFYTTATNTDELALTLDSSQNATFAGSITTNLSAEGTYFTGGSGGIRQLSLTSGTNTSAHALHTFNIASSNGKYKFDINGTEEFSIDSSNATFTGNVDLGNITNISMSSGSAGQLRVLGNGYTGAIALDGNAMHIYHNSSSRDLILGTNETARLTIDGSNGNATFAGDVTVSGGDITLGGTGRIQGIDTVTDGTDAVNKDYVDNLIIVDGSGAANQVAFFTDANTLSSESVFVYDAANNRLGVNVSSPSHKFHVSTGNGDTTHTIHVSHTRNDPDTASNAVFIDANYSGTKSAATDTVQTGLKVDLDSSATGDATNEHRIYGLHSDTRNSGFADVVYGTYSLAESNYIGAKTANLAGVYGISTHDSSSTNGGVVNQFGVKGVVQIQDNGDVDNAYGGQFQILIANNRGADVGVTVGVEAEIQIDEATALTYGEVHGFRAIIDNNEAAVPTFGNQYLFKGDYQGTRGDAAYGIYSEGDRHYFEGSLGIGTTSPAHDLDIESTNPTLILTQSGAVNQANSGRILFAEAPAYSSGHFEIKYDGANNRLRFNSPIDGTSNLMNIGRDGLIGIDVATPSYKLDIQNAGSSGINISGTGAFVRWNSGDMQIRNDGSYAMAFDTWTGSALTEKMLIDSAGNIIIAGQTVNHIKTDTSDGSDNKGMVINSAGGSGSSSRGAYISMYGNEHTSLAGDMYITAGNTSGAELRLNAVHSGGVVTTYAGGNLRHTVSSTETSIANYLEVTNTIATENVMGTSGEWNAARIRVEATNTVDTTGFTGIRFATSTADNYGWSMGANRSGSGRGSLRIFEHSGAATGNERFTIKQDGNVGIGTNSPSAKLHIHATSGDGLVRITGDNIINSGGAIKGFNNGLAFNVAPSGGGSEIEAIRIQGSGNVGIGETNPQELLHLTATTPVFRLEGGSHSYQQYVNGTSFYIRDVTNSSNRIVLDSSGVVTITRSLTPAASLSDITQLKIENTSTSFGGSAAGIQLDAGNGDTTGFILSRADGNDNTFEGVIIGTATDNPIIFSTNTGTTSITSNERMRIDSDGNVGIGTTTPAHGKLVISSNQNNSNNFTWLLFDNQGAGYGDWNMFKSGNNDLAFGYGTSNGASFTNALTLKYGGNVGINETTPLVPLHISRDSASGENIALLLDNNNTTAGNEIGILFRSMVGSTNTDFEIFGQANAANNMDLVFQSDGSVERMRLKNDGDLQIARYLEHLGDTNSYLGWSAADDFRIYVGGRELVRLDEGTNPDIAKFMTDEFRMYSDGTFHADGDIIAFSTTTSSDKRLKKNIKPITNALDIVEKLQGVHFDWKKDDEKSLGYIAQDVEKVLPEMVKEHEHFGNGEYKTVNYAAMVSIMGEAIKELKAEVEELKKQIK